MRRNAVHHACSTHAAAGCADGVCANILLVLFVSPLLQDKDGPKALDEFCRDLCEEVRLNKIDPVSTAKQPLCRCTQQLEGAAKLHPAARQSWCWLAAYRQLGAHATCPLPFWTHSSAALGFLLQSLCH